MAIKSLYLKGGTLTNGMQPMQEDGVAPTDAFFATSTGWQLGTTGAPNSAGFRANTLVARGTFSATLQPDNEGLVTGAAGNAFRTPTAYTGTFAAGNWTLSAVFRSVVALATTQTQRIRYRVYRSANADGTGATEITNSYTFTPSGGVQQTGQVVAWSNTVAGTGNTTANLPTTSLTWAAPAITLDNEYLFFVCACQVQATGGTGTTRNMTFRQNSASAITTPDFGVTVAPVELAGTMDITGSESGVPEVSRNFSGALNGTIGEAAVPNVTRNLAGSLNGTVDSAALLAVERRLASSLGVVADSAGVMLVERGLASSLSINGSSSGLLEVKRNLAGALNGSAGYVAAPQVTRNLASSLNMAVDANGVAQVTRALVGVLGTTKSYAGELGSTGVQLAGSLGMLASLDASALNVTRTLVGSAGIVGSGVAALQVNRNLAVSLGMTASSIGTLQVARNLAGVLGNAVILVGELESNEVLLAGELGVLASLDTGGIVATRLLSGALPTAAGYQAAPEVSRPLRGILEARVAHTAAPPEVTRLLSGMHSMVVVLDTTGLSTETLEPVMVVALDPIPSAVLVLDSAPGVHLVLDLVPDAKLVLDPLEEVGGG